MRASFRILPLLALVSAACSTTIIGGGVGGGGGDLPVGSSSSGVIATSSSGSVTTSSGGSACSDATPVGLPSTACTPTSPTCGASSSVCLATAHAHGAPNFGLRMAHIELSAPSSFTNGVVKSVFQNSAAPSSPLCNLSGSATFNWLLRFDTTTGTLVTGAAKPVPDPSAGYTFVTGQVPLGGLTFDVAPVTLSGPLSAACSVESSAGDVLLPFYGDQAGNTYTILPLRRLRFFDTHVTPDHDCIGAFNAAGLDPANNCLPDAAHPGFIDGGSFDAFMVLEDADEMLVGPLGETLCVLLAGDAQTWGDGGNPHKCKRDAANHILFQGDWCSATNQPASGGCADAVRFAGSFAASGVAIKQ